MNGVVGRYAAWFDEVAIGMFGLGLATIILGLFYARGFIYYITNRRIVVRRRFLTHQVTVLPMDQIVEVTAFKSMVGRLLRHGDVNIALTSGGGVRELLAAEEYSPKRALYKVQRVLRGVPDPFGLRDLILELRQAYIESLYLSRMEEELVKIRKGVERLATAEEWRPRVILKKKKKEVV